jgi:holo-[acyl-carrier protein] synthase
MVSQPRTPAVEPVLGLGIDLVEISRFRETMTRFGARLEQRLFTAGEKAYCEQTAQAHRAQHFAARFAAKEAWIKASGIAFRWTEIEVVNRPGTGAPELRLHGRTAAAAREAGIGRVLLTLTHAGDLAIAHVLTLGAG